MLKPLITQPMVIADKTVPGIAHQSEGKEAFNLLLGRQPFNVRQTRMLPKPTICQDTFHPPTAFYSLGGVAQHNIILHGPVFQGQSQRGSTGLWDMHKDEVSAAR